MLPQSVVLLVTPKIISDFSTPQPDIIRFFEHYRPLISQADETIVIFAVGNSDHILNYRGANRWSDSIEWARSTDFVAISERTLNYHQLNGIVQAFRRVADDFGLRVKIFDHVDSGSEFTLRNDFKYHRHPECTGNKWGMFDIRGRLQADNFEYATAPNGVSEGKLCGEFLVDQLSRYLDDLNFDGILYDNQLGTRGRWRKDDGPGFSQSEATAISSFFEYSRRLLDDRQLMWFDSYNDVTVERQTFSFPEDGYSFFDYLIASGFCAVSGGQYSENLKSKLQVTSLRRVLATLDYVDPWYSYASMTKYPGCSEELEQIAVKRRYEIDGVMFFANDAAGDLVPRPIVESFAARFFRVSN